MKLLGIQYMQCCNDFFSFWFCCCKGFMFQVGLLGSIMYTSSLSLHFLLIIRYKWLPSQVKKIDPFIHSLCILIPLGTAVVGWIKKFYNPTTFACYVQGYPTSCLLPGEPKCIRGEGVKLGLFFMLILPILLSFIFITTAMIMIYFNVYHQDQRMSRYQHGLSDENRMSRQAFWMACQYISAFCVSFTPVIFIYMIKIITGGKVGQVQFYFLLWQALLSPLQGFLNAIVYSHDLKSQLKYVRQSIASSFRNARGSIDRNLTQGGIERNRSFDGRQENEIASLVEQAGSTPSQAKVEQKELSIDDSVHEDRSNQKAGNITSVLQYINESEELSIEDSVHKDRNNHEAGNTTSVLHYINESEELSIDDSVHKDRNNHEAGDTTSDLQEISESV